MERSDLLDPPAYELDEADRRLQFLVSSGIRTEILRVLNDAPLIERDLRDRLDAPRSTVHQNVEKLVDRGWVEETPDGYRTTWIGATVLDEYATCVRNIEAADRLEPLLTHADESAIDVAALRGADVTASRPNRPNAAIERIADLCERADDIDAFTPCVVPRLLHRFHERVARGDLGIEVIVSATADAAILRDHDDLIDFAVDHDAVSYYRYDGDLPFALLLLDGTVALGAFDDRGHPRAVVEADGAAAREWAESVYARFRDRATRVTSTDHPADATETPSDA